MCECRRPTLPLTPDVPVLPSLLKRFTCFKLTPPRTQDTGTKVFEPVPIVAARPVCLAVELHRIINLWFGLRPLSAESTALKRLFRS